MKSSTCSGVVMIAAAMFAADPARAESIDSILKGWTKLVTERVQKAREAREDEFTVFIELRNKTRELKSKFSSVKCNDKTAREFDNQVQASAKSAGFAAGALIKFDEVATSQRARCEGGHLVVMNFELNELAILPVSDPSKRTKLIDSTKRPDIKR